MIEIKGKYNTAIVYTDTVEDEAIKQILEMCNQEFLKDSKIRIMSDVHAGAGCTIGTTMTLTDSVVPHFVGVDIGCGMHVAKLKQKEIDLEKLDAVIYKYIPSGMKVRKEKHPDSLQLKLDELKCAKYVNINRGYKSIGTLGGGNHFIEVDKDDEGNLYLVIHSGSRHLGLEVANFYQKEATLQLNNMTQKDIEEYIQTMKELGRQKEIQTTLENIKKTCKEKSKEVTGHITGEIFHNYLHDMKIMQAFASLNRKVMNDLICEAMQFDVEETFTTIHNYIDLEHMILRKGAVSARKDEKLIIPMNMKDGSLICIGKGNDDWNQSAPHGAGRIMSRNQARAELDLDEYKEIMKDIYSSCVTKETIDECPLAYKKMDEIIKHIDDTVDIIQVIKPIYNFKASE